MESQEEDRKQILREGSEYGTEAVENADPTAWRLQFWLAETWRGSARCLSNFSDIIGLLLVSVFLLSIFVVVLFLVMAMTLLVNVPGMWIILLLGPYLLDDLKNSPDSRPDLSSLLRGILWLFASSMILFCKLHFLNRLVRVRREDLNLWDIVKGQGDRDSDHGKVIHKFTDELPLYERVLGAYAILVTASTCYFVIAGDLMLVARWIYFGIKYIVDVTVSGSPPH